MPIDFNNLNGNNNIPTLNLEKAQVLDLTKVAPSLKNVILGAGWDVSEIGPSFDLDISAFLLDRNGRVDRNRISDRVIYFNNMRARGIRLEGDNLTGEGDGDDERIDINLDEIDSDVDSIIFFVTIFDAINKRQTFGMVNNSYIRLLDADNNEKEILRYPLKGRYDSDTAITFCKLKRNSKGWEFEAIGDGSIGDLNTLISKYM